MFVQVIQGQVHDPEGVARLMDRWVSDLGRDARGWLGATMGATDDGQLVGIARFDSRQDAQRNSERPEQGAWFEEFAKHFDDGPVFHDCDNARLFLRGGSDDAGFVQAMQMPVLDADKLAQAMEAMTSLGDNAFARPELYGGVMALHGDEPVMTQVAYFTSEAEARQGEATPPPPEVAEAMQPWEGAVGETRYFDLRHPWMASPS